MKKLVSLALVASACALAGCSDDDPEQASPTPSTSNTCTAAKETLLTPVDAVSTGEVKTLSEAGGVKTLFVDASAGGAQGGASNPRVYINLETATKVDVTDKTAPSVTTWDLAVKRPVLFTNSGDGGSGQGGAIKVEKDFDAVTSADAGTFAPESFFEAGDECKAKLDETNAVRTSFDGWYGYDPATHLLTPNAVTWVVKGATGKLFKVAITSYYANPDGSAGQAGGRFTIKVAAL